MPTSTICPAGAPDASGVLAAAQRLVDGRLPSATTVTDRRCAADYLVADLRAPRIGTVHVVLRRTDGAWHAVAVGSYPCRDVRTAPPAARTLLHC